MSALANIKSPIGSQQSRVNSILRERVGNFLAQCEGADVARIVQEGAEDVLSWLRAQLRGRVVARRRAEDLARLLAGRELSKRQVLRLFLAWLDQEERIGGEDFIAIE